MSVAFRPTLAHGALRQHWLALALLACAGCSGAHGPSAARIRPDTNDCYEPQGVIHFVEHGRRARGVLVSATDGFDSRYSASWVTVLVPTPPSDLAGPVWSGTPIVGEQAVSMANLPCFRRAFNVQGIGELVRFRFRQPAVWILSTDPFIIGLPAGDPKRTWRQFAVAATGVWDTSRAVPALSLLARFVADEELDQPVARVVLFPSDFWQSRTDLRGDIPLAVVTLPEPDSLARVLDVLTDRDVLELGPVATVLLREHFNNDAEFIRARNADRARLLAR